MTTCADEVSLVNDALIQDRNAVRQFVDYLTPTIHIRITKTLLRWVRFENSGRQRHLIDDLTQDVFLELFRENGHALRSWEPNKGAALKTFVGLIAERKTHAHLRVKKNAYLDDEDDALNKASSHLEPEKQVGAEHLIHQLTIFLKDEISELGREVFSRLFFEEKSVEEICKELSMTPDAVYAWKGRLRKKLDQWRRLHDDFNNQLVNKSPVRSGVQL